MLAVVDAGALRRLVMEAFEGSPFERVAPGRWQARTDELIWALDLDRGRSWSAWAVMVGIVVREWHADLALPRHHEGDVMIEYPMLGEAVPPAAAGSCLDDHLSYFTMVFDHRHDLISEQERRAASMFMTGDLVRLVEGLPAVSDLRAAVPPADSRAASSVPGSGRHGHSRPLERCRPVVESIPHEWSERVSGLDHKTAR